LDDGIVAVDARYIGSDTDGIGRYALNLLQGIVEAAPDFQLHLLISENTIIPRDLLASKTFRTEVLMWNPRNLADQARLPGLLRRRGIKALHSIDPYAPLLTRCRRIITIHDLIPVVCRRLLTRSRKAQWWRLWRWWLGGQYHVAARVIAVSEHTAKDIRDILRVDGRKTRVIHNGIIPASAVNEDAIPLPDDVVATPYLLYVGRRDPHKNLPGLIRAFAEVRRQFASLALVIVGASNSRYPQAEQTVRKMGLEEHVRFIGHATDGLLDNLYRSARVFVFPCLYEGFGLPPLEAMARGAPVVAGNRTSLPEILGDAAILTDAADPDQLAEAILRVLSDDKLAERLRRSGFERASQFTARRQAEETLRLYEEVATP
jgi:glycosyltransferase involved in cell wall biosynthesis